MAKADRHSKVAKIKNPDEVLAQADPTAPGPPPLASSGPVGSIAHSGQTGKRVVFVMVAVALAAAVVGGGWYLSQQTGRRAVVPNSTLSPVPSGDARLALVAGQNYGNKYANGILPVGDGKYTTDGPKKGYVYACGGYAQNLAQGGGGASSRGPWFVGATQWDVNKKVSVQGHVNWTPSITDGLTQSYPATRVLTTNDLPSHYTGAFPIGPNDPAYAYDHNPNSIKAQSLSYDLATDPAYGAPQCMGGQVGVMLTGVALFNAFDAGGRDAGAWEVQDGCSGHPEKTGEYHYHTLSKCITDVGVGTVIGFALDGFPITGPKVREGNILTTDDLDVCHGITSEVTLDGKKVTMYHYVMTQDFPYSASCFRAKAIQPPGLQSDGTNQPAGGGAPPPGGVNPGGPLR